MKKLLLFLLFFINYLTTNGQSRRFINPGPVNQFGSNPARGFNTKVYNGKCGENRFHTAKDYCDPSGCSETLGLNAPVFASGSGRVSSILTGDNRGLGNTIIIAHKLYPSNRTIYSLYAHLNSFYSGIAVGDYVPKGTLIGYMGKSGSGAGLYVHLHFEIRNFIDPHRICCGCVGYAEDSANGQQNEINGHHGYYNPLNYIEKDSLFNDLNIQSKLLTINGIGGFNYTVKINNPFSQSCTVNARLILEYCNASGIYRNIPLPVSSTTFNSGTNYINFQSSQSIPKGFYKISVQIKHPSSNEWYTIPPTPEGENGNTLVVNSNGDYPDFTDAIYNSKSSKLNSNYSYIKRGLEYGLFNGRCGEFYPNSILKRGQAAKVLVSTGIKLGMFQINLSTVNGKFTDVDTWNEYFPYIQTLRNYNRINTSNTLFRPDDDISYGEFCKLVADGLQLQNDVNISQLKSFTSGNNLGNVSSTYKPWIDILYQIVASKNYSIEKLIDLPKTLSEVNSSINRALMAKILVNAYEFKQVPSGQILRNARVQANISKYSIIGNKLENNSGLYGDEIPESIFNVTQSSINTTSGQIINLSFNSTNINGSPLHFYWTTDDGVINTLPNFGNFQSIKFTAPTVTTQTIIHLYAYAANDGGFFREWYKDIIVNPTGTPPTTTGISIQTASSKDFGNIDVGQFGDEIITVTNPSTSTGSLVGSISAPTGVDMSISPLTTNGLTFNLAPGQSKLFYIRFEPQSAGTYTNSLNISHNATNVTNPMSVSLTGVGISNTVAQSLNCSGAGTIACGSVTNGTTSGGANNAQFYCSTPKLMTGPEKIYSFTPSITNEYFVKFTDNTGGNLALFILGTCNISAGCNAIVSGVGSTIERVFFNAGTTYYFVVDGENSVAGDFSIELVNGCPIQYYTPSGGTAGCLRMGILNVLGNANMNIGYVEGNGSSYQRTFILKNEANTYVNCNLSFSGRDAAIFSVFEGTNISLQPYETKTLTLIFTPPASSDIKAYLDITHNAACTPLRMQINGTTVPTFIWTRPTGGETFYNCTQWLASSNTVSWTKNIPGGTASIEVSLDGGITWQPYFTSGSCGSGSGSSEVDNDGSDWFNANGFCTTKGKMRIKMIGASDPWTESPGYFTIRDDATSQALYVKYPNGAEIFEGASWVNIQWNNANNETVTLKYSTDGGNSWTTIGTGITGISYNWKVPYSAQNQTNCKIGVFGSSSTDYSDCAFTIFAKTAPSLTYTQNVVNPPCNNSATGSASVSVTAGVGPYTYSWKKDGSSISGSSNSQSNLAKGSYEVTINDAGGNQIKTAIFGLYCTPFTITATTTSATCTKNNGSASISISPTGNYSYTWNTGETSSSINNKVSGTYSLTVTNITTGCSQTQDVYIPSILSPVNVSISTAPTLCQGTTTNITATPTGGTAPYAYAWSNGGNTQTVALGAGNYQSVVTDANGCQGSSNVIINGYTQTIGGVLSPQSQTICQNVGSVNTLLPEVFTLSGYTGNILRWEYKTPAGVWTNWNLAGSTTSGNCCFGTAIGNWKVRAVVRDAANNCPEAYSAEGDVIVMSTPTAILSGTQTINVGQTATLTVNFTGSAPWSFVLNGQTYSDILTSPYTLTITPTATNTYTLTSMTGECGTGTVSGSAIVTVNTTCTQMYTLKTGNWNDVTVWSCGRVPTSTDIITIKANHIITIPASYTANTKDVNYETGGKISPAANTSKLCLNCPPIPTNGLIGYYPLNGNANDASGNGLNGSIVGSITSITDRKGIANSAYQFSGVVLNYISIPDNALLCSNIITLNAWVNFAPSEGGYIINKGRDIQNGSFRLYTGGVAGQVLYNGVNDASYASVPTNQWVMVTGIINGNNAKYYVNGVMVSQATLSSSYVCSSAGNPLTIGNHYYNGVPNVWAYPYKGKIDDVRIYNRALLDAEVLQIYNAEKP